MWNAERIIKEMLDYKLIFNFIIYVGLYICYVHLFTLLFCIWDSGGGVGIQSRKR